MSRSNPPLVKPRSKRAAEIPPVSDDIIETRGHDEFAKMAAQADSGHLTVEWVQFGLAGRWMADGFPGDNASARWKVRRGIVTGFLPSPRTRRGLKRVKLPTPDVPTPPRPRRGAQTALLGAVLAAFLAISAGTAVAADPPAGYCDRVVRAIYLAEGGAATRHPYGILGKGRLTPEQARRWCLGTVRANWRRWEAAGRPGDYVDFLASRYAPVGVANDPSGLNRNWPRNVRRLMDGR